MTKNTKLGMVKQFCIKQREQELFALEDYTNKGLDNNDDITQGHIDAYENVLDEIQHIEKNY